MMIFLFKNKFTIISLLLRFFMIPGSFNQDIKNNIKVKEVKKLNIKTHQIFSTSSSRLVKLNNKIITWEDKAYVCSDNDNKQEDEKEQ